MRRLRVAYLLGFLLLSAASLHSATAYSASPGDPPAGSPSSAVYKLPFEQGRTDAAPKSGGSDQGGGGTGGQGTSTGGAAGQGEAGSLYRTENNFGSSSHVPGLAAGTGGRGGGPGGLGGVGGGSPAAAAGGAAAAGAAIVGGAAASQVTDAGNTSIGASIALLGVIALLAVGVGALSRRFALGRSEP